MTIARTAFLALLVLAVTGIGVLATGYRNARADPVIRRIAVALPG